MEIIYLNPEHFPQDKSSLKNFLNFYRSFFQKKVLKYHYVSRNCDFLSNLSLLDNITLEYSPIQNVERLIHRTGNPYLLSLFRSIKNPNAFPHEASQSDLKLSALVKGLISSSPCLFLEDPELNLSQISIQTLLKAINFHTAKSKGHTFIYSKNFTTWKEITTGYVKRDQHFQIVSPKTVIPMHSLETEIKTQQLAFHISQPVENKKAI